MRFWDASAVVPLLLEQRTTRSLQAIHDEDSAVVVWWSTDVECSSAIARLERQGHLSRSAASEAVKRLRAMTRGWHEVQPAEEVRESAKRFLRVHDLRAADALQLAAAVLASERRPSTLGFVCLDERLSEAAEREGFSLSEIPSGGLDHVAMQPRGGKKRKEKDGDEETAG